MDYAAFFVSQQCINQMIRSTEQNKRCLFKKGVGVGIFRGGGMCSTGVGNKGQQRSTSVTLGAAVMTWHSSMSSQVEWQASHVVSISKLLFCHFCGESELEVISSSHPLKYIQHFWKICLWEKDLKKTQTDGYVQLSILIRKMAFRFGKLGVSFMSSSWKDTLTMERVCFIYNQIVR